MVTSTLTRDAELQREVLREVRRDPRVEETEVGVEVDRGVVTLTGTVGSYDKKLAAGEAAHRVPGVLDVANDIQIKIPGTGAQTDTEVAQTVRKLLEWEVLVPHERIQTTVAGGWVTLGGEVALWSQREAAERAVRHLAGVRGVRNTLTVRAPRVAPDEVRRAIEEALERRAAREASRIDVVVRDGIVTVSGPVRSWLEVRAVVGAVSHVPGVQTVKDRLTIDPSA